MSRFTALAICIVLWAAIYLPGLGSTELKGEEGRRILPAVTMLETGNWLVPYLGGKPYLRKPPLMNWLIAGSFKLTGVRNEWSARLPSALAVLAMGLTMIGVSGRRWMKPETALIAAILAMTFFGLLAKARFAGGEIEGVFAPLFGIAMTLWAAWWTKGKSPWLTWTVPFLFLGIGALAKGPLHLLFFYGIVGAVLWRSSSLRKLLHPAHFVGLALMLSIFMAWEIPFHRTAEANKAAQVWKDEMANRFTENKSSWGDYAMNLPRGIGDLLPWILLAPAVLVVVRRKEGAGDSASSEREEGVIVKPMATAILGASAVMFVVLLLVPGVLPRYVLPLSASMALGGAVLLGQCGEGTLRRWHRVNQVLIGLLVLGALVAPVVAAAVFGTSGKDEGRFLGFEGRAVLPAIGAATATFIVAGLLWARRAVRLSPHYLAVCSAAVLGSGSLLYGAAATKKIAQYDDLRPLAAQIDKSVPTGEELVIYDPGYQAALFYLKCRYRYAAVTEEIPSGAPFVLIRARDEGKLAKKRPELGRVFVYKLKGQDEFVLLQPKSAKPAGEVQ